jgi:hypothetical protein
MDSTSINQYGFSNWIPLLSANSPNVPQNACIFVVRNNGNFGRLKGLSDILYIGETNDLSRSVKEIYKPGPSQSTNQRLNHFLTTHSMEISYTIQSVISKSNLLNSYELDHDELPPCNRTN